MPQLIPIQAVPNQSFTTTINNNLFDISIRTSDGITAVSIAINGTDIINNLIAVANGLIIPAQYQEVDNFMFVTANYEMPLYTQFNINQSLIYFSASELATYREPPSLPITESFFDPNGALPLRFQPSGYVLA